LPPPWPATPRWLATFRLAAPAATPALRAGGPGASRLRAGFDWRQGMPALLVALPSCLRRDGGGGGNPDQRGRGREQEGEVGTNPAPNPLPRRPGTRLLAHPGAGAGGPRPGAGGEADGG